MADWSHPAMAPEWLDPTVGNDWSAIHEYDDLAAEARAAFDRRRASYPDLVKSGRLTADDARADLEAWQAIARDWRWIAFGDGEPATIHTLTARMAALDTAIDRWLDMIHADGGGMSLSYRIQGMRIGAMRWWAQRELSGAGHRITAACMHDWRRENGLPTRGQMIAAARAAAAPSSAPERKAA